MKFPTCDSRGRSESQELGCWQGDCVEYSSSPCACCNGATVVRGTALCSAMVHVLRWRLQSCCVLASCFHLGQCVWDWLLIILEELGPREASRCDQHQHLKCGGQSRTRAQACARASSALCGCEVSASDLLAQAPLLSPVPVSALTGFSLRGSQVQNRFFKELPSNLKQLLLTLPLP